MNKKVENAAGYELSKKELIHKIKELEFPKDIRVTISGGLKEYNHESIDKLLDEADKYLYEAKNNGGN